MNVCDRLSDRMPAVALGRERWSPDEEAHLSVCRDCRAEWELLLATGRLGARAPAAADPDRIAADVLRRLREEPGLPPRSGVTRWAAGLAAAAAIAAAVWAGLDRRPAAPTSVAAVEESLTTAQLDSLLDTDPPLAGWSMLEAPTLGDLDEDELEQVLRTWEG